MSNFASLDERLLIKMCLCLICRQNKTLQLLNLDENQIGDAGAVSIGDALAYVQLRLLTFFPEFYTFCAQIWHATD